MSSRLLTVAEEGSLLQFGSKVRAARLSAGMSQENFAHRCGLDRSYVGQIERGERNVSLLNMIKLASGLDIPAADLLLGIHSLSESRN